MVPNVDQDLIAEIRRSRGQSTQPSVKEEPKDKKKNSTNKQSDAYEVFLRKYHNLDQKIIEGLNTRDILYYFREVAKEEGYKYVISNFQKDMAIIKRMRSNYSIHEVLAIIEFVFRSDQDYLDKSTLSPGIISSSWCNTLHTDSQLWLDDKYIPKSKKKKKLKLSKHEWTESIDVEESGVGEWK